MPAPPTNNNNNDKLSPSLSGATATNNETHWFLLSPQETATRLETSLDDGLSENEVESRLRRDGPNELSGRGGVSIWSILAGQVCNAMVLVLVACMAVSFGIESWIEGGVIAAVIAINVFVGFIQEYGSAKTMDSLRSLASPNAHVVRNGKISSIPSPQVVVGDIVEVKTGDTIPADLRLIETVNFETDEALLTGESLPVAKDAHANWEEEAKTGGGFDPRDIGLGDRITIAYSSSTVTKGRAKGIVVATGMTTAIGAIAESLRGGDSKVRKVRRNDDGHAPWHRYPAAWALTVMDAIGQVLGVNVGTPLQRTLSWLAIALFGIGCLFALFCFAANDFKGNKEIILYAISTALAMIPASLVVVLTITLAGGTKAMVKRNVIVRKLDSLEALGAVTDICSDKTGTLTQGKMVVRAAWVPSRGTIHVGESNEPFNPTIGDLTLSKQSPAEANTDSAPPSPAKEKGESANVENVRPVSTSADDLRKEGGEPFEMLLNVASMCNVAKVWNKEGEGWTARGDPTECAIQTFAHRFGHGRESLTEGEAPQWIQLQEFPFDSDLKRMSVLYARKSDEKQFVFMKGAVERILDACTHIQLADGPSELDEQTKEDVLANVEALAEQGLRVLGLASKPWHGQSSSSGEGADRAEVEKDLTLYGLVGLYDPPRPETQGAVRMCHHAGVQVHMLTGDHAATARAIAVQVGILPRNLTQMSKESIDAIVMTAARFDKLSDDEVDQLPLLPLVIARCAPHTKVRMVEALHRRKAFVAMTGDGVNDSPSLKRADIGIGMGTGSDVAKDASDIVLSDDNFASILAAIEEGRRLFYNISRFVLHLLAGNIMQGLVLLIGLAFKDDDDLSVFPLAPVEILWVIMITSSFPAMGLGAQKADPDVLQRKPHNLKMGIFKPEILIDMIYYGITGAGCCIGVFALIVFGFGDGNLGRDSNNNINGDPGSHLVFRARSATFAAMVWICLFLAFEVMDMRRSFFKMWDETDHPYTQWARDVWNNQFLFWSVILGFVSVFPVIFIPKLNTVVFKHSGVSWEIALPFISTLIFLILAELWKWGKRVYFRRRAAAHPEEEELAPIFAAWKTIEPTKTKDVSRAV
ncbi:hypothetical protein JCM8097_006713 [Rhodosporidiobolus ruineniae]